VVEALMRDGTNHCLTKLWDMQEQYEPVGRELL
jgi:hypothetical protein